MTNILNTKEIIKYVTLGIPKGMKKKFAVSISSALRVDILVRNKNGISKEYKTKNRLK